MVIGMSEFFVFFLYFSIRFLSLFFFFFSFLVIVQSSLRPPCGPFRYPFSFFINNATITFFFDKSSEVKDSSLLLGPLSASTLHHLNFFHCHFSPPHLTLSPSRIPILLGVSLSIGLPPPLHQSSIP